MQRQNNQLWQQIIYVYYSVEWHDNIIIKYLIKNIYAFYAFTFVKYKYFQQLN